MTANSSLTAITYILSAGYAGRRAANDTGVFVCDRIGVGGTVPRALRLFREVRHQLSTVGRGTPLVPLHGVSFWADDWRDAGYADELVGDYRVIVSEWGTPSGVVSATPSNTCQPGRGAGALSA